MHVWMASRIADALSSVSASSAAGSESYNNVAPARTAATPSRKWTVLSVSPVFIEPSNATWPTAPPYHARGDFSCFSMNRDAHALGAPVTVTAHVWHRNASKASKPSRRYPSTWSTVWMSLEYISIWRRPRTDTVPGTQTLDLSLRSTSVHIVSSDSSFAELRRSRTCEASSMASSPRSIVPDIGHVSTRSSPRSATRSTRTNISGDAPTRNSRSPKFMTKPYGAGFRWRSSRNTADGDVEDASTRHCWERTTSKRLPALNSFFASATISANSPGAMSRASGGCFAAAAVALGGTTTASSRSIVAVSRTSKSDGEHHEKSYVTRQAEFSR
mmetsp:Transcript_22152/g.87883  ORF Transcript_22152/g.87883 Transcript_22152/m.87883 type:complete len:330 (+) Transcript_22152:1056-2045(+)